MAMILDAFVGRYVDKLSEFVDGEISMMLGVKDELKKLQRRMERIRDFLESAEQKRRANQRIDAWVRELKDIMYDADDIIDDCMIEGRKLLEDHPSESAVRRPWSLFSCFNCIKFRHKIGSKIIKLNDRLKEIAEDRLILPMLEPTREGDQVSRVNHRQTFSIEVKSDIVGIQIENDTQSLVESIIIEDDKKYRVFGIVGMGGIGKTTLASHIYNDEKIKNNFPIRVWACVSHEFSETKLLKDMITNAGGSCEEAESKDRLLCILSSVLSKRFFIVLDDVWRIDVWEGLLRYSFENATAKGRIAITTRDRNVARNIRAEIHDVDKMDNDNGWKLFSKIVFGDDDDDDDDEEEEDISSLKEIGVKIVEKCDGLPLAIKVMAGVLRSKERSNIEWNKVLGSEVWSTSEFEDLPRALFLSYENLPSDLKQCFLYCSLFPEDYEMDRDDLIRYWVVEGFIKRTQGDIIMEDLAEDYYRELIGRNLLQPCDRYFLVGNYCKMHDLLRSLALFLTRDESIFLGDDGQSPNTNPSSKLRRLSMFDTGERVEVPDAINQQKCLRTLLVRRGHVMQLVENELFKSWRFLRVINLSCTGLVSLPDSVGDLSHLRYLDLTWSTIEELPESIGCLVSLEMFILSYCTSLHALPKAVTKLCNLRCLRLEGTPLTHVPKGIGKLKHLNHLQGFVVGHDDRRDAQDGEGCGLEELQSLSRLRFLCMRRLGRARPGEAPVLANSPYLRTLILEDGLPEDEEEANIAIQRIDKIYNGLHPRSTHLQKFVIDNFVGTGFPNWMMSSSLGASFPNLTSIELHKCISCPQLPPLGLLPQLKNLSIDGADAIKTIGPEFLGSRRASSAASPFPKLEVLKFRRMSDWEEWSFGMVEGVGEERRGAPRLLPRLGCLELEYCPELRALPPLGMLPELTYLSIKNAHAIKTIGPEFLGPRASSAATSFPKLEVLIFEGMSGWKEWSFGMLVDGLGEERRGAPELLPRLRELNLSRCPKLRALPEGLQHATNLQRVIIDNAGDLIEINNLPFSTDSLEISWNESLERVSNLPSLKYLKISDCPRLKQVENIGKLQFLKFTTFGETSTSDADRQTERLSLPRWLLDLLQNAPAGLPSLKEFELTCSLPFFKTFLKDGPNWFIIQRMRIPHVRIEGQSSFGFCSSYVQDTQDPPTFETRMEEESEGLEDYR